MTLLTLLYHYGEDDIVKFCTNKRTMSHRKYLERKLPFLPDTLVLFVLDLLFFFQMSSQFVFSFLCFPGISSVKFKSFPLRVVYLNYLSMASLFSFSTFHSQLFSTFSLLATVLDNIFLTRRTNLTPSNGHFKCLL